MEVLEPRKIVVGSYQKQKGETILAPPSSRGRAAAVGLQLVVVGMLTGKTPFPSVFIC
jgi:hypothetical protein